MSPLSRCVQSACQRASFRSCVFRSPSAFAAKKQRLRLNRGGCRAGMATQSQGGSTLPPALTGLQPVLLWQYFSDLCKIPRPSKHEQKVLQYLQEFALQRTLEYKQDAVGNVVIKRPGSAGGEKAPTVVIQGHVDMVCEKNSDVKHDFFKDPIQLARDGDWLKAVGTTLGADNGIGVATALALLALPPSVKLPPLECLFTVDEETGLTGAYGISGELLSGRTMLNLDTEDWGEIFIGCAGGGDTLIQLDLMMEPASTSGMTCCEVKVSGLLGGHSGLNIAEDRGNAVRFAAQISEVGLRQVAGLKLVELRGGDKRNAIPREASAIMMVPNGQLAAVSQLVTSTLAQLRAEYGVLEKDLSITLAPTDLPPGGLCIAPGDAKRLVTLLLALPHGPAKFSHTVPGLVETSSNLAAVKAEGPAGTAPADSLPHITYTVTTSTRSSLGPALEHQRDRIELLARLCGGRVSRGKAYPGWLPNPASPVLQLLKDRYQVALGGSAPKVGAIHAGLECGILGEKFPGMDMVSFGPTIRGAHSPDERVQISTVDKFWDLTLDVLAHLADRR